MKYNPINIINNFNIIESDFYSKNRIKIPDFHNGLGVDQFEISLCHPSCASVVKKLGWNLDSVISPSMDNKNVF